MSCCSCGVGFVANTWFRLLDMVSSFQNTQPCYPTKISQWTPWHPNGLWALREYFLLFVHDCIIQDELSRIKKQLLRDFSPDESYPIGAPFMETPEPFSHLAELESQSFDEVRCFISIFEFHINHNSWLFYLQRWIFSQILASNSLDEVLPDASGSHSGRRTSMSSNSQDILSVNQLLESVSSVPFAEKVVLSIETLSFPSVLLGLGQTRHNLKYPAWIQFWILLFLENCVFWYKMMDQVSIPPLSGLSNHQGYLMCGKNSST